MTLSTHVYTFDECDVHETFHFIRRLLGCRPEHSFEDGLAYGADPSGPRKLSNTPRQGLPAWLLVTYRDGAMARNPSEASEHDYCEDDCDGAGHRPAFWLDINLDTSYSYLDDLGGCGSLHARLVDSIGRFLDERHVRWAWVNEFTGEMHAGSDRYDRLSELER